MWPFKKTEPKPDPINDAIAELKAFRDIGETFIYLGRTCMVTAHFEHWPHIGAVPMLKFDYCDNHGVLHSDSVWIALLPGLIKQQLPKE